MNHWKIGAVAAIITLGLCVTAARQNDQGSRSSVQAKTDRESEQKKDYRDSDHLKTSSNDKWTSALNLGSLPSPPFPSHLGKGRSDRNSSENTENGDSKQQSSER